MGRVGDRAYIGGRVDGVTPLCVLELFGINERMLPRDLKPIEVLGRVKVPLGLDVVVARRPVGRDVGVDLGIVR